MLGHSLVIDTSTAHNSSRPSRVTGVDRALRRRHGGRVTYCSGELFTATAVGGGEQRLPIHCGKRLRCSMPVARVSTTGERRRGRNRIAQVIPRTATYAVRSAAADVYPAEDLDVYASVLNPWDGCRRAIGREPGAYADSMEAERHSGVLQPIRPVDQAVELLETPNGPIWLM